MKLFEEQTDWVALAAALLIMAGLVTLAVRVDDGWTSASHRADAMEAQVRAYQGAVSQLQRQRVPPTYDTLDLSEVDSAYRLALVRGAERAFDLPAGVMYYLIGVESSWRASAVSSVGAVGLAQVKPSTARTVDSTLTREDLFRPEVNVMVGAAYLRRMLDRYDGDVRRALRAYNAGPTRVDHFDRQGREVSAGYADRVLR